MAAIDCLYLNSWKDYQELKEFLKDKEFTTPRGVKIRPIDWLYDLKEKYFIKDNKPYYCRVFNTPGYIDNWLYHNCNLPFIQEWLESRYFSNGYCKGESKEITEELKLPDYKPCTKVKIIKKGFWKNPRRGWWIEIKNDDSTDFRYNEDYDFVVFPGEYDCWTISSPYLKISIRAIIRKIIKKWKLPKGCTITIQGRYEGDEWILKTK